MKSIVKCVLFAFMMIGGVMGFNSSKSDKSKNCMHEKSICTEAEFLIHEQERISSNQGLVPADRGEYNSIPTVSEADLPYRGGLVPADRGEYNSIPTVSEADLRQKNLPYRGGLVPADRAEYNSIPPVTETDLRHPKGK